MPQPMTVDELLADDDAVYRFINWQPSLIAPVMWIREAQAGYISEESTFREIAEQFGPSGAYPIDWSALGISHMINFATLLDDAENGLGEDMPGQAHADGLIRQVFRGVDEVFRELLQPYVDSFMFSEETSAPTEQILDLNDVDWGTVESFNAAILKDLAPGNSIPFWQNGQYVILGDTQSAAWRMAVERANGYDPPNGESVSGWVTMDARGSTFSSGGISVTGNYEEGSFKAAIRRFSNKRITFGDQPAESEVEPAIRPRR